MSASHDDEADQQFSQAARHSRCEILKAGFTCLHAMCVALVVKDRRGRLPTGAGGGGRFENPHLHFPEMSKFSYSRPK
jgi:hypothetical protein